MAITAFRKVRHLSNDSCMQYSSCLALLRYVYIGYMHCQCTYVFKRVLGVQRVHLKWRRKELQFVPEEETFGVTASRVTALSSFINVNL